MAIEVGAAYVSILPSAKGFSAALLKQLRVELRGVGGEGEKAGKSFGAKLAAGAKSVAGPLIAGFVGGLGAEALKGLVGGMVNAASEAEQSQGAVTAIFKDNAKQIETAAGRAAQAVGLSANEYRGLASTLGAQLKNKGITDFADQTEGLITLGADLSAQFGGSTKDAVEALTSALRGETDPIERYGVSLNAAAVEQQALSMGMKKVGGQFTDQEKALASLALIQKQTADAQGTFNREQDTYAGKMQRAQASAENLKTTIGQFLLPIFTKIADVLNSTVVPAIQGFVESFQDGTGAGGQFKDVLTTVKDILSGSINFYKDNKTWIDAMVVAIVSGTVAYKAMAAAQTVQTGVMKAWGVVTGKTTLAQLGLNTALLANPIGIVVIAIGALVGALIYLYNNNETVRNGIDKAWSTIKGAISSVVGWITDTAVPGIVSAWNTMVSGLGKAKDGIESTWDQIKDVVRRPIEFVVNTVIRDGVVRAWNAVAEKLSLPTWDFKGFARGGWTGPGQKYTPAGVVHADEFVIRKEARSKFERENPGTLDFINRYGVMPGYAGGGQVWSSMWDWARKNLPGMQLTSSVRNSNDFHGAGKAIDIAAPMNDQGKAAMLAAARAIAATFGGAILELIHTPAGPGLQLKRGQPINYGADTLNQHYNHVHWAMDQFTDEMAGLDIGEGGFKIGNPVAEVLKKLASAPFDLASGGIDRIAGLFPESEWRDMSVAFAKKPVEQVKTFITDMIDKVFPPMSFGGGGESWSGNVSSWGEMVSGALSMLGQPQSLVGTVLRRMNQESGGNPRAINQWDCLPVRTRILTRRGWLTHDQVREGDETIGYDPRTGKSVWTKITRVVHHDNADIIRIGGKRWAVESTPNHRWLVEKRNGSRAMAPADEMAVNDSILLSVPAETGDGLPITDTEAALLGWIAGDGHVESGRRGPSISVAQAKREHFEAVDAAFLETPHAHYAYPGRTSCATWRMTPEAARDLMARVGHPKEDALAIVLAMSASQRTAWLGAMIRAEGTRSGGYTVVYQCEGPVRDALKVAIYMSGRRPSESLLTGKEQWRDCWAHGLTRPRLSGYARSITAGESQDVWCVTTELGTWTAEQDGQVFLTGNSNAANGIPSKGLMQVIDPTFRAYALPGYNRDIYDPMSNILASMRYAIARYGSLSAAYDRQGGYAEGGRVQGPFLFDSGGYLPTGLSLVANHTGRPERILNPEQEAAMAARGDTISNTFNYVKHDNIGEIVQALDFASRKARLSRRARGR